MAPIERILCPVDFSEASQHAIDHGVAIARWYHASITALHVSTPAFATVRDLQTPEERVPDVELERLSAEMARCFERANAADVGVDVVVEVGQPASGILERSRSGRSDLIVMGTHGATGFEHLLLGSVTEKVLRRASCPVLTVPPHAQATSHLPFRRVLCAVDLSDPSLQGLELACSLAKESDAALTVLHVVEWPWHEPPPPVFEELPPDQATALDEFRRYVEQSASARINALIPDDVRDRCAAVRRVAHGKSYVEILRIAAEHEADVIVMGVHGRNAADVMLFGSTANQVVRRATCPVLTMRARAATAPR